MKNHLSIAERLSVWNNDNLQPWRCCIWVKKPCKKTRNHTKFFLFFLLTWTQGSKVAYKLLVLFD